MSGSVEFSDSEVRICRSRWRGALICCGGLALIAGGLWMGTRGESVVHAVVGWSGAGFFAVCLALWIRHGLGRGPILVCDEAGFVDRSTALAVGRIEWSEVVEISIGAISGHRYVGVEVLDLAALLRRAARWQRPIIRLNARLGYPPVSFPQSVLPLKVEELAEILQRFLDRARSSEG